MLAVALIAFVGLVLAWVVLPTKSRSQREESPSEIETA